MAFKYGNTQKLIVRAVITACGIFGTVYGFGTANFVVESLGLIVEVAGLAALEELNRTL
jgi:hypothetical protein